MALTQKQEKFCLEYHKLGKGRGAEAYRNAGYSVENMGAESIYSEVYKILQLPDIALRINELKEQDRERNAVTVDSITKELDEARALALTYKQGASAAVSASLGKAKLHGLLIDKVESKNLNLNANAEFPLTERDRLRLAELGLNVGDDDDELPEQQP